MASAKDMLAEVDLADLHLKRRAAVEKQEEAKANADVAKARHFMLFWLGGGVMLTAAICLKDALIGNDPFAIFLLAACTIIWIWLWIRAFFPTATVRRYQDELTAANRALKTIDDKIAFCHQVVEEAKQVKVRKYAEVLVEKQLS